MYPVRQYQRLKRQRELMLYQNQAKDGQKANLYFGHSQALALPLTTTSSSPKLDANALLAMVFQNVYYVLRQIWQRETVEKTLRECPKKRWYA